MSRWSRRSRAVAVTATLGPLLGPLLLACGEQTGAGPTGSARPDGGDEPITPRALAAVVAVHTGTPSSAGVGDDVDELGDGVVAATELRFGTDGEYDGDRLLVAVGTGFEAMVPGCGGPETESLAGCEETDDGILLWETETPEEDPGGVFVLASEGGTDVFLSYSGPTITDDPRELDLPVAVEDLFAIAEDPRVRVTTSRAAIEAGEDLEYWVER